MPLEPELGPDIPLFQPPDGASPSLWDPEAFDRVRGWSDPLQMLVQGGWLPGGGPEPEESPGLPWLPASFSRSVPAPVAGVGGIVLEEDPAGTLLLSAALGGLPLGNDVFLDTFIGAELRKEALDLPGCRLPAPAFLDATLAGSPFGH